MDNKPLSPRTLRRHARAALIPPQKTGRKAGHDGPRESVTIRLRPSLRALVKAESARLGVSESAVVEDALFAKFAKCPESLGISET